MTKPDPSLLVDVVAAKVLDALKLASEALTAASVRHVVVGGLAVGANGYPRATKVVDFLVGAEAFHHHANGLVTMRPEIPFRSTASPWTCCPRRLARTFSRRHSRRHRDR